MTIVTSGQVDELVQAAGWKCLVDKVKYMLENEIDRNLENPDPFTHGRAVGAKKTCQVILSLPEIMRKEWEASRGKNAQ